MVFIYEFSGSEEDRLKLYKDIEQLFPRASAPRRLPLNFAEGKTLQTPNSLRRCLHWLLVLYISINPLNNWVFFVHVACKILGSAFRSLADTFLRRALQKGVPPLFITLKRLYKDPKKVRNKLIQTVCKWRFGIGVRYAYLLLIFHTLKC